MTWERGEHALLFHDDKRRTFLRGRCSQLGLGKGYDQNCNDNRITECDICNTRNSSSVSSVV